MAAHTEYFSFLKIYVTQNNLSAKADKVRSYHRITEFPEMNETHKDHRVQHCTAQPQKSLHVSKSIVQMLCGLRWAWCSTK